MAKLYFKKLGSGQPLIVLHGLYGSSDNWMTIAKVLSQTFCVYVLDLRNHGRSPHLPEHNYSVMVNDLYEFIDNNKINNPVLLGHSMGGKIAMFFAASYPYAVKKLIVVDISPRTYKLQTSDTILTEHNKIFEAFESVNLSKITSRNQIENVWINFISDVIIRKSLLKNIRRNRDNTFSWKLNYTVLKQNLHEILNGLEDYSDKLKKLNIPVLFIKASNSGYIKVDDIVMIKEIFGNSRIVTIENVSHYIHTENPDKLINIIENY
jgi:pimeloyl-ACP methyl ester carboxylesterase